MSRISVEEAARRATQADGAVDLLGYDFAARTYREVGWWTYERVRTAASSASFTTKQMLRTAFCAK